MSDDFLKLQGDQIRSGMVKSIIKPFGHDYDHDRPRLITSFYSLKNT